jgi:hypothetical protein
MDAARAQAVQRAGGRFVGVTTSTPERAKEASVDLNADRAFLWPEALTADEQVDVVHICVPNLLPVSPSLSAFAAGDILYAGGFEGTVSVENEDPPLSGTAKSRGRAGHHAPGGAHADHPRTTTEAEEHQ